MAATAAGAATINYGSFLNAIINFLIVAFAVFVLVKQTQRFRHQEESKHVEPPKSELLLAEIRDLLKERQ